MDIGFDRRGYEDSSDRRCREVLEVPGCGKSQLTCSSVGGGMSGSRRRLHDGMMRLISLVSWRRSFRISTTALCLWKVVKEIKD